MIYVLIAALFAVGFYGVLGKRHVLKKILGLVILDYAINLLLIAIGYRAGGEAPIRTPEEEPAAFAAASVDPVPQALVLTSIVIGLGATMMLVALALRLHERHGTLDTHEIRSLHG